LADEEEAAAALCEPRDRRLLDTRAALVLRLEDGVVAARWAGVVAYMMMDMMVMETSNTEAGERIAVVCGLARMSMVALRAVSCRTTNHERTINTTAFFVGGIENEKG
jgi:hypothetical protein